MSRSPRPSRAKPAKSRFAGHNVLKGYWRRPEETAKAIPDGWFRTGDIGRVDKEGYFFIVSPLIAYYRDRGILLEVDADQPPEAVTTEILTRLSDHSPKRGTT